MSNPIEHMARRQRRIWSVFLFCFSLLVLLLITRGLLVANDLNEGTLGVGVLALSLATLASMVFSIAKLGLLQGRVSADPRLRDALVDDQRIRLNVLESWRAGFIVAALTPICLLLISGVSPLFNDPLSVALLTPIAGSGAFLFSLYAKSG